MTNEEYLAEISRIRASITKGQFENIEEDLAELYLYKPVSLLWFTAKAELLYNKYGRSQGALNTINGKYYLGHDNCGLRDALELKKRIFLDKGNTSDAEKIDFEIQSLYSDIKPETSFSEIVLNKFMKDPDNLENIYALENECHIKNKPVLQFIIWWYLKKVHNIEIPPKKEWLSKCINFGYLKELLDTDKGKQVVIVVDKNSEECDILTYFLTHTNVKITIINEPVNCDVHSMNQAISISLANSEKYPDAIIIPAISFEDSEEHHYDNTAKLVENISTGSESGYVTVFSSTRRLDELCADSNCRRKFERLTQKTYDRENHNLAFGWCGDYLKYISDIYGMDAKEEMNADSIYDFSFILPVRNATLTLESTLRTCLNQDYKGSYEIVLSDNSELSNQSVRALCERINDKRINYIRTPKDLPLNRSFEYAYLKSRGNFLLAIGADDAVFPWTLRIIKQVIESKPDIDVFQWHRGFYAWPGFNDKQENQLVIPGKYAKDQFTTEEKDGIDYLAKLAHDNSDIFKLPLLYINSGCRRKYLKKIYSITGRLWDGCNQDMYMGLVNACINKKITIIKYPLAIAGMSNGSMGLLNSTFNIKNQKTVDEINEKIWKCGNSCVYVPNYMEMKLPQLRYDVCSVYNCLMRLITAKVIGTDYLTEVIGIQKMIISIVGCMSYRDDMMDKSIEMLKESVSHMSKQVYDWFISEIYPNVKKIMKVSKIVEIGKYEEKDNGENGSVLDASKYGITNIEQAVKLFMEKTGL